MDIKVFKDVLPEFAAETDERILKYADISKQTFKLSDYINGEIAQVYATAHLLTVLSKDFQEGVQSEKDRDLQVSYFQKKGGLGETKYGRILQMMPLKPSNDVYMTTGLLV